MRLICPNCDAQYEVPDNVIPEAGRDVQCSDCGNTWFQEPASAASAQEDPVLERQAIPPEVSEILQEEAAFEQAAREREAMQPIAEEPQYEASPAPKPAPAQNNPFAGIVDEEESDHERRARETRERMARMRGVSAGNPFTSSDAQDAAEQSRKSVLPDVDELNSSLVASEEAYSDPSGDSIDLDDLERLYKRSSGFRSGFTVMVFAGLLVFALYFTHDGLARAVPPLAPGLDAFVALIDQARLWVDGKASGLMAWMDGFVAGINPR